MADEEHLPTPGDCTFCDGCGNASVFTDEMQLRKMSDVERAEAPPEFHVVSASFAHLRGEKPT